MTIWFHEGLPRSGKSYEAMVKHALEALKKGRKVITNIKGVNFEKIAELLGKTAAEVEALFIIVPWEDTPNIWKYLVPDAIVLLDEVQDFWPSTREKLGKEITEFITQHGHHGLDIVLMGQAHKDVHNIWRRRIDKLIYFVQKDAVGKPTEYYWTLYKQTQPDKFAKISSGSGKYDEKYFGIYKSHEDHTTNKEAYEDDRANIWNTPALKYGIPVAAVVGIGAVWFVIHFFTTPNAIAGGQQVDTARTAPAPVQPAVYSPPPGAASAVPASADFVGLETYTPPADFVQELFNKYRPRLSGLIYSGKKMFGKIDFYKDDDAHRRESMTFAALEDMGYSVEVREYGVEVSKGPKFFQVTAWPFDQYGAVPQRVQNSGLITGQQLEPM